MRRSNSWVGFLTMTKRRYSGRLLLDLGLIALLTSLKCTSADDTHGPKCLNCEKVNSPTDCKQTKRCWAHEECYSQHLVSASGATWYNFGCKTQEECRLLETAGGRGRRFDPTITTCERCCTGDACNTHICSTVTGPRPISCFSCEDTADPHACHAVKHCHPHEMCYAESVIEDNPVPKHTLGCVSQMFCDMLTGVIIGRRSSDTRQKRKTQLCQKCCRTSGCNSDICVSEQPSHQVTTTPRGVLTSMTMPLPTTAFSRIVLRLAGMNSAVAGRLEVFYQYQWGTVCDDGFDARDARVACRQLGFSGETALLIAHSSAGSGPIWLDNVQCVGNELTLSDCSHLNWGQNGCSHSEDVFIRCSNEQIRLVSSNSTDVSGRLEINEGQGWGTICDDNFNVQAARVACRQLGLPYETATIIPNTYPGSGPIWLDQVQCYGHEPSLLSCGHLNWGQNDCSHNEDIFISCGRDIRLAGMNSLMSGRLEVYYDSQWGTVCDDAFDFRAAEVACRQLGLYENIFNETALVIPNTLHGSGPIWLDDVICQGGETSLSSCRHLGWGQNNCGHGEDVFIRCGYDIRLVGNSSVAGRLEVYHDSQWGSVCDDNFDVVAARVACRQLGFSGGTPLLNQNRLPGSGIIWLDEVQCSGQEPSLFACGHATWGQHNCGHGEDVYLRCGNENSVVRLVNGSSNYEGRVEVLHYGQWGTVCDDSFSNYAAMVVCSMLGFQRSPAVAMGSAHFGQGTSGTPILLDDVICQGDEIDIDSCQHRPWGSHNCGHSEDVGVICHV